ncbi:MAG: heat-inducible transcriptional repressor HrcA [Myxococcota bacterium]
MELDVRKRAVLRVVIEAYIDDAQPVSSAVVARQLEALSTARHARDRHAAAWSPATIRNVMAELEAGGFLAQPHTSAGRIPTEKGLRLYLDDLMSPKLRPWDRTRLDEVAAGAAPSSLPTALGQSLAGLSGQVALIVMPSFLGGRFREIGLVRVNPGRFIAFFVSVSGLIQQKLVEVDFDLTPDELMRIQNFLNERLAGRSLDEVRALIARELGEAESELDLIKQRAYAIGQQAIPQPTPSLVLEGTAQLIEQPEFADVAKLRSLVHAIEDKTALLTLLDKLIEVPMAAKAAGEDAGTKVVLASEHDMSDMLEVSFVGRAIASPSGEQATVSILGPSRMDYGRLVALVDYASQLLSKYWERI